MSKKKRTLIVVGRLKEFDEEAWKRLLLAYTYYLHEQRTDGASTDPAPEAAEPNGGAT
jgi:hypothetical protein